MKETYPPADSQSPRKDKELPFKRNLAPKGKSSTKGGKILPPSKEPKTLFQLKPAEARTNNQGKRKMVKRPKSNLEPHRGGLTIRKKKGKGKDHKALRNQTATHQGLKYPGGLPKLFRKNLGE